MPPFRVPSYALPEDAKTAQLAAKELVVCVCIVTMRTALPEERY